jgi:uncharacterized protein (TIGR00303 family)
VNALSTSIIQCVNDPHGVLPKLFAQFQAEPFQFVLCLGATETSDVEGISAAGATANLRRLTAAVDAEALLTGKTFSAPQLPVSPIGIVSPVVITRACLQRINIEPTVVDCGTFIAPMVAHEKLGNGPSKCVSTGSAMSPDTVQALFQSGIRTGDKLAIDGKPIVLAECVPGGTTTALAVLTALGRNVRQSLSSSLPQCNHDARWSLAQQGLEIARRDGRLNSALSIIAAVGDPMQPFAAGVVLGAQGVRGVLPQNPTPAPQTAQVPIILAGGSQMLAVYDLVAAISREESLPFDKGTTAVVTTKWVAFDTGAKLSELSAEIGAPFAAACPDFTKSRHPGLRAYEQGNVKEGVGAGASMLLWSLRYGAKGLMDAIDRCYIDLTPDL